MLTQQRCEAIFGMVTDTAKALGVDHVEAAISASVQALTRFANNAIHQNVTESASMLSLRTVIDRRTARATTNRFDPASIREALEEAVNLTRLQEPDPDLLPLVPPAVIRRVERSFRSTANTTAAERARAVRDAIAVVESQGQTAAGIYSTADTLTALMNTRGVLAYYPETLAQFSITAMAPDSSGWAKASACHAGAFEPAELAARAALKAARSADPVELPPGRYTAILEPAAVLDLTGQMFPDFSATAIRDGRSFLNDRTGTRLFGSNITILDDAYHPLQAGAPFDAEGVPRQKLMLVDKGVVREVAYSRQAAHLDGAKPTGHGFPLPNEFGEAPVNLVMEGGRTSIGEMVASTRRGILVTRLWYIREVDPYEKIMTGMTRDGTFLVENGEIVRGIRNFRFNQSLIEMLNNVEALSPSVRASGEEAIDMVSPALKVRDFNFTEVTRF